jgi:hypothetical protein
MDGVDEVEADQRAEHVGQRGTGGVRGHVAIQGLHEDQGTRSGGHFGGEQECSTVALATTWKGRRRVPNSDGSCRRWWV